MCVLRYVVEYHMTNCKVEVVGSRLRVTSLSLISHLQAIEVAAEMGATHDPARNRGTPGREWGKRGRQLKGCPVKFNPPGLRSSQNLPHSAHRLGTTESFLFAIATGFSKLRRWRRPDSLAWGSAADPVKLGEQCRGPNPLKESQREKSARGDVGSRAGTGFFQPHR